jgi:hypothetical protein
MCSLISIKGALYGVSDSIRLSVQPGYEYISSELDLPIVVDRTQVSSERNNNVQVQILSYEKSRHAYYYSSLAV